MWYIPPHSGGAHLLCSCLCLTIRIARKACCAYLRCTTSHTAGYSIRRRSVDALRQWWSGHDLLELRVYSSWWHVLSKHSANVATGRVETAIQWNHWMLIDRLDVWMAVVALLVVLYTWQPAAAAKSYDLRIHQSPRLTEVDDIQTTTGIEFHNDIQESRHNVRSSLQASEPFSLSSRSRPRSPEFDREQTELKQRHYFSLASNKPDDGWDANMFLHFLQSDTAYWMQELATLYAALALCIRVPMLQYWETLKWLVWVTNGSFQYNPKHRLLRFAQPAPKKASRNLIFVLNLNHRFSLIEEQLDLYKGPSSVSFVARKFNL